jgi:hypothetical protein
LPKDFGGYVYFPRKKHGQYGGYAYFPRKKHGQYEDWQARRRPEAGNACKTRERSMVSMRPGRPEGGQKQEMPVKREKEAWSV